MARRLMLATLLLLLAAGPALAQRLAPALPEETVFAIGTEGIASQAGKLDDVVEEAERLGLAEALAALFAAGEEELQPEELAEGPPPSLTTALEGVDTLELIGQEAWFTVSVSSYNPLPAVTFVSRTAGEAIDSARQAIEEAAAASGAETATEGAETIYLYPLEVEDSPFPVLAVSQVNDIVVVSTNPDVLRGVLRRLAGSNEPGFESTSGYRSTLGELGSGHFYSFLDYKRLARSLEPLGAMAGFELLIGRALTGLGTIGVGGTVMTIEQDGLSSSGIRIPGTGDPDLAALLTAGQSASEDPLAFVPDTALAVNVTHLDLPGWWNYLRELARSSDDLGNPDLNELVMQFTGIDIQSSLFDWMGTQAATVTGSLATAVQPGVPSENLLGDAVYLLETTDEAAARQGLGTLLGTIGGLVAGFADPTGQGTATIEQRQASGFEVTSYAMGPGLTIAYTVVEDWVLIATSDAGLDNALSARASGGGLRGELARMAELVPEPATSFGISDLGATLQQSGAQTASQLQMFAGMTGGQLDFDALQEAGEKIEAFFAFIADRAGGSVSYTVPESGGAVLSHGMTEFSW